MHGSLSNFNPRSPWGERRPRVKGDYVLCKFQSTLPVGGATKHFSPPAFSLSISIHAPRGGSDLLQQEHGNASSTFQSTLPVGGATYARVVRSDGTLFQSTLPVGGATPGALKKRRQKDISIHAPRGGSDWVVCLCLYHTCISIHAPRGGSD